MAAYTAIDDPGEYFQIVLFTGTGSSHSITGVGFSPSLVWMKGRSHTTSHNIVDSVRGVTKVLEANGDYAEQTNATSLTAFGADGFTLGTNAGFNGSARTYASWNWLESATSGVDIVSYTGNGTDDTDISHSLSAVPKVIMVKNRSAADAWQIYHHKNTAAPETDYLVLDTTAATADAADRWSDEAPTSSVFTLGDGDEVNTNTENYIAYCFSEKQGFSKFGSYTGNGNVNGTFVYLGFRPAFVLTKKTSAEAGWYLWDNKRPGYNQITQELYIDDDAETSGASLGLDFLSNGFKWRASMSSRNESGGTYVYMAFAEAPFVNSNGVPCNAR